MKFEVGKIYRCTNGLVAKCLFGYRGQNYESMVGEVITAFPGWEVGGNYHFSGNAWSEVKEPRRIVRWVRVWENLATGVLSFGDFFETEPEARNASAGLGWKLVDVIRQEYVEKI